jgi:hypothetical protein
VKINWNAVAQALIIALLTAVGATAWQTYGAAQRLPQLEADVAKLEKKLDDIKVRAEASDDRLSDQVNDMKITLAVLESRSAYEAARHGKQYAPATMEGR